MKEEITGAFLVKGRGLIIAVDEDYNEPFVPGEVLMATITGVERVDWHNNVGLIIRLERQTNGSL